MHRRCQVANKDYEKAVKSVLAALRTDPGNTELVGEDFLKQVMQALGLT